MSEQRPIFRPMFWTIPAILSDDSRIEPFDEKVYAAVAWFHQMKDGVCKASNKTLAELIKPSDPQPRSVQNSLSRLEECGYIAREYKDVTKRNRSKIIPLIVLKVVRNGDDRQESNETAMIDVRNGDDRANESVMTRVIIQSKKRSKNTAAEAAGGEKERKVDPPALVIDLFKVLNPTGYHLYFARKPQRAAAKRLLEKHGMEKLEKCVAWIDKHQDMEFFPSVESPCQLEEKWTKLESYARRKVKKENNFII